MLRFICTNSLNWYHGTTLAELCIISYEPSCLCSLIPRWNPTAGENILHARVCKLIHQHINSLSTNNLPWICRVDSWRCHSKWCGASPFFESGWICLCRTRDSAYPNLETTPGSQSCLYGYVVIAPQRHRTLRLAAFQHKRTFLRPSSRVPRVPRRNWPDHRASGARYERTPEGW